VSSSALKVASAFSAESLAIVEVMLVSMQVLEEVLNQ